MRHGFLLVIPLAVLLSSCASVGSRPGRIKTGATEAAARPSWIDGDSAEYPRSRFLAGVGSAEDPAAAKDRARAEISKVFSTRITVNTAVSASEYSQATGKASDGYSFQNVAQNVRAVSNKDLEGVEIVRTWHDSKYGVYYALAVLDRSKAASALRKRLQALDAGGRDAASLLSSAAEKFRKAKYALKLMDILDTRKALAAEMRVLDPAGLKAPGPDIGSARREAAEALSGLDVLLVADADMPGPVATAVIKALNGLGIEAGISSSAGRADIIVECSVKLDPVPDPDPRSRWKWYRGEGSVVLKDVRTSKIFLNFDASAREASSTAEGARLKAEVALGRKMGSKVLRGVYSFLEDQ